MNKWLLSAAACAVALGMLAQGTTKQDTVTMRIQGSTVTITTEDLSKLSEVDLNQMIREINAQTARIQGQLDRDLKAIAERERAGELTPEQAEAQRQEAIDRFERDMEAFNAEMEAWGEAYGARMEAWGERQGRDWEAWGEEYGQSWERWAEQWERDAERMESENRGGIAPMPPMPPMPPFPGSAEQPRFDDGSTRKPRRNDPPQTNFKFDIHFGINNLFQDGQLAQDKWSISQWNSFDFNFAVGGKTRLGQPGTKFYFKYGLGFERHNLRLKGTNVVYKTADFTDVFADSTRNIAQSTLGVWYLTVPLMFEFDASERGMDNAFTLGVGGYAGLRTQSWRRVAFDDAANDRAREYTYNNWFMNPFHYGVIAQMGYGPFKITGKYDLNSLFQTDRGPELNLASITLGFSF
jgi:hypothetical protein